LISLLFFSLAIMDWIFPPIRRLQAQLFIEKHRVPQRLRTVSPISGSCRKFDCGAIFLPTPVEDLPLEVILSFIMKECNCFSRFLPFYILIYDCRLCTAVLHMCV